MVEKDEFFPKKVKKNLKTKVLGKKFYYFEEVDSTNHIAKELAKEGVTEGTVVISETQKTGRGRLDRKWISPSGGLWFSIILRPKVSLKKAPLVTLLTGVAVAKVIRQMGLDAKIKWPNDVLINKKKVCGILTEIGTGLNAIEYIIVGIGINVNIDCALFPVEFKEKTTSLKEELNTNISRVDLMKSFLMELEHFYDLFNNQKFDRLLSEWKSLSETLFKNVRISTPTEEIEGKAIDINSDGSLILELSDGSIKTILAGDCTHVYT